MASITQVWARIASVFRSFCYAVAVFAIFLRNGESLGRLTFLQDLIALGSELCFRSPEAKVTKQHRRPGEDGCQM